MNLAGTSCLIQESTCEKYSRINCRKAGAGGCFWNTVATPSASCKPITTLDCTKITASAPGGLNYISCNDIDSTCSVNADGSACILAAKCTLYT